MHFLEDWRLPARNYGLPCVNEIMISRINCVLTLILIAAYGTEAQERGLFDRQAIKGRMLKVAEWQLANPNHQLNQWTNAAFYAGIFAAYETTRSAELMKSLMDMGEKN